jgi:hypothetical protein
MLLSSVKGKRRQASKRSSIAAAREAVRQPVKTLPGRSEGKIVKEITESEERPRD